MIVHKREGKKDGLKDLWGKLYIIHPQSKIMSYLDDIKFCLESYNTTILPEIQRRDYRGAYLDLEAISVVL